MNGRLEGDRYYTPAPVALALCRRLRELGISPQQIIEPHAGLGAFVDAARATWPESYILAVDIDDKLECPNSSRSVMGNSLHITGKFDLVLGNPPYRDAEKHATHALRSLIKPNGAVAFLVRLSFLSSRKRSMMLVGHRPSHVFVLQERPSFTQDGGHDMVDYAFILWRGKPAEECVLDWISWRQTTQLELHP